MSAARRTAARLFYNSYSGLFSGGGEASQQIARVCELDGSGHGGDALFSKEAQANAAHLVACWNAHEPGGLVEQMAEALLHVRTAISIHHRHDECAPCDTAVCQVVDRVLASWREGKLMAMNDGEFHRDVIRSSWEQDFLREVERRAGATREEMLMLMNESQEERWNLSRSATIALRLRRILGADK